MILNKKNNSILIVVIIFILTTMALLLLDKNYLVIKNADNNEIIANFPLNNKGDFAVSFKHSVNQSLVEDRYKVVNGEIVVYETLYYNFGAGVQTEIEDGQILIETEDGGMIASNIDKVISELIYRPSPVYDHTLKVDNKEISLTKLANGVDLLLFEVSGF